MPANTKYLSSPLERTLKILAGILGGYLLSMSIHMLIGVLSTQEIKPVLVMTTTYTALPLWIVLIICAFLAKKAWHVWSMYVVSICMCVALIFLFQ